MRARLGHHQGVVVAFDSERGIGTVRAGDGRELAFHCTAVAGGTRTIEVGTPVCFDAVPGHLGHWEASPVTPLGPPPG